MHEFTNDFYGHHMKVMILGYIRPELDYVSRGAYAISRETSFVTDRANRGPQRGY